MRHTCCILKVLNRVSKLVRRHILSALHHNSHGVNIVQHIQNGLASKALSKNPMAPSASTLLDALHKHSLSNSYSQIELL